MPKLMLLSGSMRLNSCSLSCCRVAEKIAQSQGSETRIVDVRSLGLPAYIPEQEIEEFGQGQQAIQTLIEGYRWADAYLWCSPAYHGTTTGAFKNALDFAEFLSRDNPPYLQGKPVGIVAINDCTPFPAMRESARELRAWVAPTHVEIPETEFGPNRELTNERTLGRLTRLIKELLGDKYVVKK